MCQYKIKKMESEKEIDGKGYVHWTLWRDGRQCGVFGVKVYKYEGSKRDALDFSLKAVQVQEKKLGLTPSTLPGGLKSRKSSSGSGETAPSSSPDAAVYETINPLDD